MIQIPVDKIGEVIGPKGKRINEIIALTGADIDIEDDGRVFIGSREGEGAEQAIEMIEQIVEPADARGRGALRGHRGEDHRPSGRS